MPQIIISDGKVLAVCDDSEELYNRVPKVAGSLYYDYNLPLDFTATEVFNKVEPQIIANDDDNVSVEMVPVATEIELPSNPNDPRATMTLTDAKNATINCLQKITRYEIQSVYPIQLQSDITNQVNGHDSAALNTMKTFINGKYTVLATKTGQVNALTTVEDVLAYNVWA
jgi:hypothetical protein